MSLLTNALIHPDTRLERPPDMSPSLVSTIPLISELSKSIILELNADDLSLLVREIPEGLLPSSLLSTLEPRLQHICLLYCILTWKATAGKQCPKAPQCQAALAVDDNNDVFLRAKTGFGKTLAAVLNQILRLDDKITIIITPMKRIQSSHVRADYRDVAAS